MCLYYSFSTEQGTILRSDVNIPLMLGIASCVVQIGGTVGSITAGAVAKYGKKNCLHATNLITIIGCALIISSGPYTK